MNETAGPITDDLPDRISAVLREVCGAPPVALHAPRFNGNEWRYVKDCLDSTFVSSVGAYVDRFEAELAAFTGAKHAVAVGNGTAALHVALLMAGVQPNDEVIIPALTFVATANAVHYCGAVPHFVDSSADTLGMDATALRDWLNAITEQRQGECVNVRTGRRIRAMLPMHTFGHPFDVDGLLAVARDFNIVLVEDAAESIGSTYHGRHTGTFGLLGTLSFNGNKTITTGGGGAVLTNDTALARRAKHITTTAKVPHRWAFEHDEAGFNYRLPNLNAALGCAQLEQLPGFIASKRRLYERYRTAFAGMPRVRLVASPAGSESNYWLQVIVLDPADAHLRDTVLTVTNDAGLMTRPVWTLMHRLAPYRDCPRAPLPTAELLEATLINIPSSAGLA
ncbi:LegC family aminotransferase [bacterium]|nr:LegC family aminotransferase [bacterium]